MSLAVSHAESQIKDGMISPAQRTADFESACSGIGLHFCWIGCTIDLKDGLCIWMQVELPTILSRELGTSFFRRQTPLPGA